MASISVPAQAIALSRRRRPWVRDSLNWVYLLPTLAFFVVYQVYPILWALYISFTDYHFLRVNEPIHFTGLKNFAEAITDPLVHLGLLRAATFTAIFLPGVLFIPLFVAILVDRVRNTRLATVYRLILLMPVVIPGTMIFILWRWLYDFEVGPINVILINYLHLFTFRTAPQWLGNSPIALPALALVEIWWGLGYHTMFFLAGLASIPHELFEQARVDGANEWQLFWNVTFPRLRPIFLILAVIRFGSAMAVIDEYLVMWHLAFQIGDWFQGYAAAIGWFGAIGMIVVVVFLFRVFRSQD